MALTKIVRQGIADDAIDGTKIADDVVNSEHFVDAGIDSAHINADAVTATKIGDDVINSEHIAAGAIDLEHMSSDSIDEDNLKISNSPTNGYVLTAQSGNTGGMTWAEMTGGGPSLGTDSIIRTNAQTISENITIGATTNGMSAGPITIADSYTVTVNGNWSIV
jgi:hypothetical protein